MTFFKKRPADGHSNRRNKRLVFLYVFLIILFSLAVTDFCCETIGLPLWAKAQIVQTLRRNNILMTAGKIHVGIFKGISIRNAEFKATNSGDFFKADQVLLNIFPRELFSGVFLPLELKIINGEIVLPLFPERGQEAKEDVVRITKLNSRIFGTKGLLNVRYAEGYINGIHFNMFGKIDNLLHISLAHWLEISRGQLLSQTDHLQDNPFRRFISEIPIDFREKLVLTLERMEQKKFLVPPSCQIRFFMDLRDFEKCTADAVFTSPAFLYGKLKIGSMRQEFSLGRGRISLKEVKIALGGNGYISLQGTYNSQTNTAIGEIVGKANPEDIMLFFDEQTRSQTVGKFRFGKGMVSFKGNLKKFSFDNAYTEGSLSFQIPSLNIDGIEMKKVRVDIQVAGSHISGRLIKTELSDGGNLSGEFLLDGSKFSGELEGIAGPQEINKIVGEKMIETLNKYVRFTKKGPLFSFSGKLFSREWKSSKFEGKFNILLSNIEINKLRFNRIASEIVFTPEKLQLNDMEAFLENGSKLNGNLLILPDRKIIVASLIGSGAPQRILKSLSGPNGDYLRKITKEIRWPDTEDIIEVSTDIHANYGEKPFLYMTGNMVLKNFAYQDIPFKYGAAKFIIARDRAILLPKVILKNRDGRIVLRAVYKPGPPKDKRLFTEGEFDFELNSTIAGNDLIHLIYPQFKSDFIDFPYPIQIESAGMIDYANPANDHYDSTISNGSCLWRGMKVDNLDVELSLKNNVLSFSNAASEFCKGRVRTNYEYNFLTEKGSFDFEMTGADAMETLKRAKCAKFLQSPELKGTISASAKGKIAFRNNDELLLYGKGNMILEGTNIWSIPILTELVKLSGKVWNIENFGAITKITSDFSFKEDTLRADLASNGGIIALYADGTYKWTPGTFNFTVRPVFLKNILPFTLMSQLLSPVSWVFSRKIHGNSKEFHLE